MERKELHNLDKEDVIAILTDLIIGGVDTVNIYFWLLLESTFYKRWIKKGNKRWIKKMNRFKKIKTDRPC